MAVCRIFIENGYLFYLQSQKHQHSLIKVTLFVTQKYSALNKCLNNSFFFEESEDSTFNFIMLYIYKDHKFAVIPSEFQALHLI